MRDPDHAEPVILGERSRRELTGMSGQGLLPAAGLCLGGGFHGPLPGTTDSVAQNNRTVSSHRSGGQKSKSQGLSAGSVPS